MTLEMLPQIMETYAELSLQNGSSVRGYVMTFVSAEEQANQGAPDAIVVDTDGGLVYVPVVDIKSCKAYDKQSA